MRFTLNDIEVNLLHNCMFIEEMAEREREKERERDNCRNTSGKRVYARYNMSEALISTPH